MYDILKTSLTLKTLLICLFVLIMGISAGIFFGSIIPGSEMTYMVSLLQNSTVQIIPNILINLAVLTLIGIAGFTIYGFPLALIILLFRSFAVGFCDYLLLYSIDSGGILNFVFSFLLPQLLLCTLYLITTTISTGYALSHLNS